MKTYIALAFFCLVTLGASQWNYTMNNTDYNQTNYTTNNTDYSQVNYTLNNTGYNQMNYTMNNTDFNTTSNVTTNSTINNTTSTTDNTTTTNTTPSCQYIVGNATFDLCSLNYGSVAGAFNLDLSFSAGSNMVSSCSRDGLVWATFTDLEDQCFDIATSEPEVIFQDSDNQALGGINVTFPLTFADDQGFQLIIQLNCDPYMSPYGSVSWSLSQVSSSGNGTTTFTISGTSYYGCSQPVSCPLTPIDGYNFELCDFNNTFFNVSNNLGFSAYFTLGIQNLLSNCQSYYESGSYAAQYEEEGSRCFPAAGLPSYQPLIPGYPQAGLRITFVDTEDSDSTIYGEDQIENQFQVILYCDSDATDFSQTDFTLETEINGGSSPVEYNMTITIIGSSSIACPVSEVQSDWYNF